MRSILNKRGAGVEPLMILILGITVLSIIGFAAYLHYSGKIEFFKFLPDFNTTKEKEKPVQILRYDIVEDTVQYYDGTKWHDFPSKEFKLGDKEISERSFREDLIDNYWYDPDERDIEKVFEISIKAQEDYYKKFRDWRTGLLLKAGFFSFIKKNDEVRVEAAWWRVDSLADWLKLFWEGGDKYFAKSGDMRILLIDLNGAHPQGFYIIRANGDVLFVDKEFTIKDAQDNPTLTKEVKDYFLVWRDSILQGKENAKMASVGEVDVCVKGYDNKYLVVNLADKVKSDGDCK